MATEVIATSTPVSVPLPPMPRRQAMAMAPAITPATGPKKREQRESATERPSNCRSESGSVTGVSMAMTATVPKSKPNRACWRLRVGTNGPTKPAMTLSATKRLKL